MRLPFLLCTACRLAFMRRAAGAEDEDQEEEQEEEGAEEGGVRMASLGDPGVLDTPQAIDEFTKDMHELDVLAEVWFRTFLHWIWTLFVSPVDTALDSSRICNAGSHAGPRKAVGRQRYAPAVSCFAKAWFLVVNHEVLCAHVSGSKQGQTALGHHMRHACVASRLAAGAGHHGAPGVAVHPCGRHGGAPRQAHAQHPTLHGEVCPSASRSRHIFRFELCTVHQSCSSDCEAARP